MADPKYKDLPGIAYDQADVYETQELPESDQIHENSEDESDSIERLNISANEAFNKFKGKHINSKGVDFSDRISRKPRTGYNIYGVWELPEQGAPETPLQKLRRIQCEVKELYDELNDIKEKTDNKEEEMSVTEIFSKMQLVGKELDVLQQNESISSANVCHLLNSQNNQLLKLTQHIETYKLAGEAKGAINKNDKKANEIETELGTMKYELLYLPEKNRTADSKCVANLEQRIAHLEKVIGTANTEKMSKFSVALKSEGILDATQQLGTKASLLDSNQLDSIESRISTILQRMENLAQKKSSIPQDTEMEQKISEMYEILKQTEANSQVLPQTLNRIITLEKIHQQAARFNKCLTQLEEMQTQITTGIEGNKTLLQNVQKSLTTNLETIKNNISSLDERVKKLNK